MSWLSMTDWICSLVPAHAGGPLRARRQEQTGLKDKLHSWMLHESRMMFKAADHIKHAKHCCATNVCSGCLRWLQMATHAQHLRCMLAATATSAAFTLGKSKPSLLILPTASAAFSARIIARNQLTGQMCHSSWDQTGQGCQQLTLQLHWANRGCVVVVQLVSSSNSHHHQKTTASRLQNSQTVAAAAATALRVESSRRRVTVMLGHSECNHYHDHHHHQRGVQLHTQHGSQQQQNARTSGVITIPNLARFVSAAS